MYRYKITIEYDGTNFVGWQKQSDHANSIQETIEKAIQDLTFEKVKIEGSGRTDAGVHALGQVASFDLKNHKTALVVRSGLNNFLRKHNIAIIKCEEVDNNFHSRFDAVLRHYQYKIINRHAGLTLDRNRAWHITSNLDIEKMNQAAQYLIGQHNFSSFRSNKCQAKNPIRTIKSLKVTKENDLVTIDISAPSFLHHMVRNIAGTLVLIGKGRAEPESMKEILEAKTREASGPNAPSCGLYFVRVDY
jgi:tRNA pseudouridine38-40 synthase